MALFKNTILFALLTCSIAPALFCDQNALFNAPIQTACITDADFDVIISKPWDKLSVHEREKIGSYLSTKLQKPNLKESLELCAKLAAYKNHVKEIKNIKNLNLSPTDTHLIRYSQDVANTFDLSGQHGKYCFAGSELIAEKVYEKAQALHKEGYAVFFHGHRWKLTLLQRIYKDLYQAYYNVQVPDDFTFIHLKKPSHDLEAEANSRCTILASKDGWSNISSTLFMNKPLFGNIHFAASNSFCFFTRNYNEGIAKNVPGMEDIFSFFDLFSFYKKYETELLALKELHKSASQYGNMIAIAIPKNLVKDCVFKTRDTDKDQREYCLIMTHDIGLNPESGIKMFHFNAPHEDLYQKFEHAYTELMHRILDDIKANRNNQTALYLNYCYQNLKNLFKS